MSFKSLPKQNISHLHRLALSKLEYPRHSIRRFDRDVTAPITPAHAVGPRLFPLFVNAAIITAPYAQRNNAQEFKVFVYERQIQNLQGRHGRENGRYACSALGTHFVVPDHERQYNKNPIHRMYVRHKHIKLFVPDVKFL